MISFVSTFPPAMCGIGTYTHYLTRNMPKEKWEVIAFQLDEFSRCQDQKQIHRDPQVNYHIALESPSLPQTILGDVLWFQHSFGMWGRTNTPFLKLIEEGKRRGKKVGASFHTIHFQSEETPWGMQVKEVELLGETLPLLDFITVFTIGARRAVMEAFPQYKEKVLVLRHGVHHYPRVSKEYAREKLFNYLSHLPSISESEKIRLRGFGKTFLKGETLLIGNYGFITQDKDPLQLYEIGMKIRERLPKQRLITLFVGKIQERKDKKMEAYLPILEALRSLHDGKENLFYEDYLPEEIFPLAFRALDVAIFWCSNATQSGRMAHAQGTGVPIAGRHIEGIGETLELSGLPSAKTIEELSDKIVEIVKNPNLEKTIEEKSTRFANQYSFHHQARKHLILEEALRHGTVLSTLDEEEGDDRYPGKVSHRRFRGFEEFREWSGMCAQRS
ncbi:MAG: hypothetical protein ACPL6D_02500 [Thermodesulfobacteriota bacterium]